MRSYKFILITIKTAIRRQDSSAINCSQKKKGGGGFIPLIILLNIRGRKSWSEKKDERIIFTFFDSLGKIYTTTNSRILESSFFPRKVNSHNVNLCILTVIEIVKLLQTREASKVVTSS